MWLLSSSWFIFLGRGALKTSPPPPSLQYSWQETTLSETQFSVWDDNSYTVNDSGSYTSDEYSADQYKYNISEGYVIKEISTVTLNSNFSNSVNITTSGNYTINLDVDAYQVSLDYGQHVNFLWFAGKNGTLEYEYYLSKRFEDYSFYEENHRHIETTYEKYNLTTWELMDTWNDTTDLYEVINVTHTDHREFYPFFSHFDYTTEFVAPMFLTVQLFKTQRNDRIAWANLFFNLMIYKDKDQNGILTVGNEPTYNGPPGIGASTEWCGNIDLFAQNQYWESENNITVKPPKTLSDPSDKTIDEIASTIVFTPPVEVSETEVAWNIEYPDFPLSVYFRDIDLPTEEWYSKPLNATYDEMSPTNLTYGFNFSLNETQADFDITFGIGKITNDTVYNRLQGYGLVIPQYNFFMSSFDIDEVNQAQLSVPRDIFKFKSNNTIVAEINMGKPEKRNYTLFDFPSPGINSEFPSIGGSIHKTAIGFASQSSFYDNPWVSTIFALDDFVAQDASFVVVDSLFSMETQNYPLWNGEKLLHDPTLSIYFAGTTEDESGAELGEAIPGYSFSILLGIVTVVATTIILKLRRKFKF